MFFEYVKRAHQIFKNRITEDESYQVMSALTIDTDQIKKCVSGTFMSGDEKLNNYVLDRFQEEYKKQGTLLYPAVAINKKTIHG